MSDSVQPHRRQPTRLPRPWDSPGKNTGVGCHFLLQCMKVKTEREVAQSCLTLSDPMDCSLPGSSVHGICQARVLEWVAIAFSMPWVYTYLQTQVVYIKCRQLFVCQPYLNTVVLKNKFLVHSRNLVHGGCLYQCSGGETPDPRCPYHLHVFIWLCLVFYCGARAQWHMDLVAPRHVRC